MILYSPAKINLGLRIIKRREDGFHNLQSIMYPVELCDILELRVSPRADKGLQFSQSGIPLDSPVESNLCVRAYHLFNSEHPLPSCQLHLHKQIPIGAGLGGGSSNAATVLMGLNQLAGDPFQMDQLKELASILGSDCPFFLYNTPMLMEGRGDILTGIPFSLAHLYLVIIFPGIHISTKEAYAGIHAQMPDNQLIELIHLPIERWNSLVKNDFEETVFSRYPLLQRFKQLFYRSGALFASLSGSGSSMFGLFRDPSDLPEELEQLVIWKGKGIGSSAAR